MLVSAIIVLQIFDRKFLAPLECLGLNESRNLHSIIEIGTEKTSFQSRDQLLTALKISQCDQVIDWLRDSEFEGGVYLSASEFCKTALDYFQSYLDHPSIDSSATLLRMYELDLHLKANRFDFSESEFFGMRNYRISQTALTTPRGPAPFQGSRQKVRATQLPFEVLLYNALLNKHSNHSILWAALEGRIEELSWKKLFYDWQVLRNQVVNAFSNDLGFLLADDLPLSDDPEQRLNELKFHPKFQWLFDAEFQPENWQSLKDRYDPNIYAELYNSWIRYRSARDVSCSMPEHLRMLELFEKMKAGQWRELLLRDLKDNWVCVYVESHDFKKFNLALLGKIYTAFNEDRLADLSYLRLNPNLEILA